LFGDCWVTQTTRPLKCCGSFSKPNSLMTSLRFCSQNWDEQCEFGPTVTFGRLFPRQPWTGKWSEKELQEIWI
jgi:hypothetical protein